MKPAAAHPLGMVLAAPTVGPRIVQLSPSPGNIYDVDCFYYDPVANVSCGNFGTILAFATTHDHPVVVHECPDIHQFQSTYCSDIIHPINKVPPAIITWGLALLALGDTLAPRAVAQPPPAVVVAPLAGDQQFVIQMAPLTFVDRETPSVGSHPLLSSKSLSHGGDPPPAGAIPSPSASIRALIGSQILSIVVKPPPPIVAHSVPQVRVPWVLPAYGPPRPDPDGLAKPPSAMGGRHFLGYVGSSPIYGGSPHFHGGLPHTNLTSSAFHLLVQRRITGVPTTFLGGSLQLFHPSSMVPVGLFYLMGGLPMCLHLWHLCSFWRLLCCVL
jgi:hypothetical protein